MKLQDETFSISEETLSINDEYLEILNLALEDKKVKGFTGKYIAKHLDVSPATISTFENKLSFDYELLFRYSGFVGRKVSLVSSEITFIDRLYF